MRALPIPTSAISIDDWVDAKRQDLDAASEELEAAKNRTLEASVVLGEAAAIREHVKVLTETLNRANENLNEGGIEQTKLRIALAIYRAAVVGLIERDGGDKVEEGLDAALTTDLLIRSFEQKSDQLLAEVGRSQRMSDALDDARSRNDKLISDQSLLRADVLATAERVLGPDRARAIVNHGAMLAEIEQTVEALRSKLNEAIETADRNNDELLSSRTRLRSQISEVGKEILGVERVGRIGDWSQMLVAIRDEVAQCRTQVERLESERSSLNEDLARMDWTRNDQREPEGTGRYLVLSKNGGSYKYDTLLYSKMAGWMDECAPLFWAPIPKNPEGLKQ